MTTDIGH